MGARQKDQGKNVRLSGDRIKPGNERPEKSITGQEGFGSGRFEHRITRLYRPDPDRPSDSLDRPSINSISPSPLPRVCAISDTVRPCSIR